MMMPWLVVLRRLDLRRPLPLAVIEAVGQATAVHRLSHRGVIQVIYELCGRKGCHRPGIRIDRSWQSKLVKNVYTNGLGTLRDCRRSGSTGVLLYNAILEDATFRRS